MKPIRVALVVALISAVSVGTASVLDATKELRSEKIMQWGEPVLLDAHTLQVNIYQASEDRCLRYEHLRAEQRGDDLHIEAIGSSTGECFYGAVCAVNPDVAVAGTMTLTWPADLTQLTIVEDPDNYEHCSGNERDHPTRVRLELPN